MISARPASRRPVEPVRGALRRRLSSSRPRHLVRWHRAGSGKGGLGSRRQRDGVAGPDPRSAPRRAVPVPARRPGRSGAGDPGRRSARPRARPGQRPGDRLGPARLGRARPSRATRPPVDDRGRRPLAQRHIHQRRAAARAADAPRRRCDRGRGHGPGLPPSRARAGAGHDLGADAVARRRSRTRNGACWWSCAGRWRRADSAAPATNEHIAGELVLSLSAVKGHLRVLFTRFGLEDAPQNQKRLLLAERALSSGAVRTDEL